MGKKFFYIVFLIAFIAIENSAHALQIKKVNWNGYPVLLATGEVKPGDAERIAEALKNARRLPHGLPVILLDSVGGRVGEAYRISGVFSSTPVHTVVPKGARCASACASIIFVAGKNRTVEDGGLLGQHSCSSGGIPNKKCNHRIAEHAFKNGVSYGSIAAFVTYAGPSEMIWFSRRQADCYGITLFPYSRESGFEKSEPCPIRYISGKWPEAQEAWRLDIENHGYRAFLRPVSDHERRLELNVFCNDKVPGKLFISMDIAGPSTQIRSSILRASLIAEPVILRDIPFLVTQVSDEFSRVTVSIKGANIPLFLQASEAVKLAFDLKKPYRPISASTRLTKSRKALKFAATHCIRD